MRLQRQGVIHDCNVMPHGSVYRSCNTACHHQVMTDYDPEIQAAALAEIAQLKEAFEELQAARDKARDALHEGIVRHLRERSAPPGLIADASPYDRNHVRRLGVAADVPPLRETKPKPRARKTAGGKPSG